MPTVTVIRTKSVNPDENIYFVIVVFFTAVLQLHAVRPSVRLSVTLVEQDQISWKS